MAVPPGQSSLAAWADELGRLAGRVAHEINNLLNGVAVNLEVVRTRAARNAESSAVAPFAETAAGQLESLTPVLRSLVALTRPAPDPFSLSAELQHVVAVVRITALVDGGDVTVAPDGSERATCVSGATARLLLASCVRAAAEPGVRVLCEVDGDGSSGETIVRISGGVGPTQLAPEALAAAADAGVRIVSEANKLQLYFPAAPSQASLT